MSLTEQVGKAATATVDALRSTPAVLALVIFNVIFMALMTWGAIEINKRWDNEVERWASLVRSCQGFTVKPQQ